MPKNAIPRFYGRCIFSFVKNYWTVVQSVPHYFSFLCIFWESLFILFYSSSLLVINFKYSSLYMSILNSQSWLIFLYGIILSPFLCTWLFAYFTWRNIINHFFLFFISKYSLYKYIFCKKITGYHCYSILGFKKSLDCIF